MVYFCVIYIYIPFFLIKLHPCSLFLLMYFAFNSSMSGIDFFLTKTEFTVSVFSVCSLNESPDFGTIRKSNTVENQPQGSQGGFYCILPCYRKLMGKACGKLYCRTGIWWKSIHTLGKVWEPISEALPIRWVILHFPMLWEIDGEMGKPMYFPSDKVYHRMGI